jgi:hypothetical protein
MSGDPTPEPDRVEAFVQGFWGRSPAADPYNALRERVRNALLYGTPDPPRAEDTNFAGTRIHEGNLVHDTRRGQIMLHSLEIAGAVMHLPPNTIIHEGDAVEVVLQRENEEEVVVRLPIPIPERREIPIERIPSFRDLMEAAERRRSTAVTGDSDAEWIGAMSAQRNVQYETVETLLDLAKAGAKADFLFLAAASGVPRPDHDALWVGTRARLGLEP